MSTFIQEILGLLQSQRKKTTLKPDIDYIEFGRLGESTLNTGTSYAPKMQAYTMRMDDFIVAMGDSDTKYDLNSSTSGSNVNINLVPSTGSTDVVILEAGTNITLTNTGTNQITIDATHPVPRGYIGARANMTGQSTSLPIVTEWYALNYLFLSDVTASLWTIQLGTANFYNRIQYDGTPDQMFNIIVTFTINGWTVGDLAQFALYNNSVLIPYSEQRIEATSSFYTTGTLQAMQLMSTGDFIEVYAKAPTAATIVSVDYLTISAVPV